MNSRNGTARYLYLAVGTVILLFIGMIYGWSIYLRSFNEIFPLWTVSGLSITFSISLSCFYTGGFMGGRLSLILKNNLIVLLGAAFLFIGYFFSSRLDPLKPDQSLIKLYLFYGVFCGLGTGLSYNAVTSSIIKWFPSNPGFATGILLTGFGLGGMIIGSMVNALIIKMGLFDTFFTLAFVVAIVLSLGSFFIKLPASVSDETASSPDFAGKDYTPKQMLKTSSYWLWLMWTLILCTSGIMVLNSAATIAASFGAPAVLGLMISISNGSGRIIFGGMIDKLGISRATYTSSSILLASGIFLYTGAVFRNVILIFAGMLMMGMCYGSCPSMSSAVVNLLFGSKNYQINISHLNIMIIPAAVSGPLVSSFLLNKSNGAYNSNFMLIIIFALASLLALVLLNRVIRKEEVRSS